MFPCRMYTLHRHNLNNSRWKPYWQLKTSQQFYKNSIFGFKQVRLWQSLLLITAFTYIRNCMFILGNRCLTRTFFQDGYLKWYHTFCRAILDPVSGIVPLFPTLCHRLCIPPPPIERDIVYGQHPSCIKDFDISIMRSFQPCRKFDRCLS